MPPRRGTLAIARRRGSMVLHAARTPWRAYTPAQAYKRRTTTEVSILTGRTWHGTQQVMGETPHRTITKSPRVWPYDTEGFFVAQTVGYGDIDGTRQYGNVGVYELSNEE
jgi:hypothetical protein